MPRIEDDVEQFISVGGEKPLPHSPECEQAIVSSMIINPNLVDDTLLKLQPDDFFNPQLRKVYEALAGLSLQGSEISKVLVTEALKTSGNLAIVGGPTRVEELVSNGVFVDNVESYISIVRRKSLQRQLFYITHKASLRALSDDGDPAEIIDQTESAIFSMTDRKENRFQTVPEVGIRVLERAQSIQDNERGLSGLTTGFVDLDKITTGLQKQNLIIIAARPSMGKTGLGISIAQNAALQGGAVVGVFSLEMSNDELVQRMLSSASRVDAQHFRNGTLSNEEWKRLGAGLQALSSTKVFLDDTASATPMEIRVKARRLKQQQGRLDLIVIDYMQLMSSSGRRENRQQEMTTISRELKAMAKELNCPVIAMSQLSRAPESRTDHRPQLADLRESGAIEQDADVVAFIYREEWYNPTPENMGLAELIIAKQRNGPTDTIRLGWLGRYTRFENLYFGHD